MLTARRLMELLEEQQLEEYDARITTPEFQEVEDLLSEGFPHKPLEPINKILDRIKSCTS